jgi:hypothetical protein
MEPFVSIRLTSAWGTIAPVESATTPCTEANAEGSDLESVATPASTKTGLSRKTITQEKRTMQKLQGNQMIKRASEWHYARAPIERGTRDTAYARLSMQGIIMSDPALFLLQCAVNISFAEKSVCRL